MEQRTTVQIPKPLLARIKKARHGGQTYSQVIDEALTALQRERFLDEQHRIFIAMKEGREPYVTL